MTRFTFANLVGGRKAKAQDEEERDEAPDEEEEQASKDEEDTSAEGEEDPASEGDEEEDEGSTASEKAAFRRGKKQGRKVERARGAAIFAAADPATLRQAANLAFNTSVTPAEAKAILASAPRGDGGLGARMKGRDPAPASASPSADASHLPPELKAAQAQVLARRKKER